MTCTLRLRRRTLALTQRPGMDDMGAATMRWRFEADARRLVVVRRRRRTFRFSRLRPRRLLLRFVLGKLFYLRLMKMTATSNTAPPITRAPPMLA